MGTVLAPPTLNSSTAACCALCNATAACVGFTLALDTAKCFLKASLGTAVTDANAVSGTRPPAPSLCSLTPGLNSMGTIFNFSTVADPAACCSACNATSDCVGFTFVTAESKCYVKSSLGAAVPDAGVVSGTRPTQQ